MSDAPASTTNAPGKVRQDVPYFKPEHVALQVAGIAVSFALLALLSWRVAAATMFDARVLMDAGELPIAPLAFVVVAMLAGYIFADLMSGIVHFTFDRFFTVDTPILGANFVRPFRDHHSDPVDITRHGFIQTNGNNCLATLPALIPLAVLPLNYAVLWQRFGVALIVIAAVATIGTNQFHKWAHTKHPSPVVNWLQQRHIILNVQHHRIHHTFPYETHYCITTGWLNGILSATGFWKVLEWIGERATGAIYRETTAFDVDDTG